MTETRPAEQAAPDRALGVITLGQLLAHRRRMVRAGWAITAGCGALAAGAAAMALLGAVAGPPWPMLLVLTISGTLFLLLGAMMPFVARDALRFARAATEMVAGGEGPPAPPAEGSVAPGRPGAVVWQGRVVGKVVGPGLAGPAPTGRPLDRRTIVRPGGDQYRWLRLELRGRRYLLAGQTRLHLVDDTGQCWPVPRATVDDATRVPLTLPADLDGGDVVGVLRGIAAHRSRVAATQDGLRSIS